MPITTWSQDGRKQSFELTDDGDVFLPEAMAARLGYTTESPRFKEAAADGRFIAFEQFADDQRRDGAICLD